MAHHQRETESRFQATCLRMVPVMDDEDALDDGPLLLRLDIEDNAAGRWPSICTETDVLSRLLAKSPNWSIGLATSRKTAWPLMGRLVTSVAPQPYESLLGFKQDEKDRMAAAKVWRQVARVAKGEKASEARKARKASGQGHVGAASGHVGSGHGEGKCKGSGHGEGRCKDWGDAGDSDSDDASDAEDSEVQAYWEDILASLYAKAKAKDEASGHVEGRRRVEEDPGPGDDADGVNVPLPRRKHRENVEEDFGKVFIRRVYRRGESEPYAFSIRCGRQFNAGCDPYQCERQLSIFSLSPGEVKRRLKRWVLAGLHDNDWPADAQRTEHNQLGGFLLREYADLEGGIFEEEMNRQLATLGPE